MVQNVFQNIFLLPEIASAMYHGCLQPTIKHSFSYQIDIIQYMDDFKSTLVCRFDMMKSDILSNICIYFYIFSVYNYLTFEDDILPDFQMIFYFCQVPRTAKLHRNSLLSVELHCYHPKWTFTDKIWLAYVRLNTKGTCESQHLSSPGSGHVLLSRNYGTRRVSIKT